MGRATEQAKSPNRSTQRKSHKKSLTYDVPSFLVDPSNNSGQVTNLGITYIKLKLIDNLYYFLCFFTKKNYNHVLIKSFISN